MGNGKRGELRRRNKGGLLWYEKEKGTLLDIFTYHYLHRTLSLIVTVSTCHSNSLVLFCYSSIFITVLYTRSHSCHSYLHHYVVILISLPRHCCMFPISYYIGLSSISTLCVVPSTVENPILAFVARLSLTTAAADLLSLLAATELSH